MPKLYRARFEQGTDNAYWRFFQQFTTVSTDDPSRALWHTSRMHDRGFYIVKADWIIKEHEDGLTVAIPNKDGMSVIVAHLYDHEEEQRLAAEKLTVEVLDKAVTPDDEPVAEWTVEISENHRWLYGRQGVIIPIDQIACIVAASINPNVQKAEDAEKCHIILKNGNQITLDLPLEILYNILGRLNPKS